VEKFLLSSGVQTESDYKDGLMIHTTDREHHHDDKPLKISLMSTLSLLKTIKHMRSQLDKVERTLTLSHQKVQESDAGNLLETEQEAGVKNRIK